MAPSTMNMLFRSIVTFLFALLLATAVAQDKVPKGGFFHGEVGEDDRLDISADSSFLNDLDDPTKGNRPSSKSGDSVQRRDVRHQTLEQVPSTRVPLSADTLRPEANAPTEEDRDTVNHRDPGSDGAILPKGPDRRRLLLPGAQQFWRTVRARSVILDQRNGFDGAVGTLFQGTDRLVPTSRLSVELFDADSRRIRNFETDRNGRFRVDDIESGIYQFVARGETGFLAFSLLVVQRGVGRQGQRDQPDKLGQRDDDGLLFVQVPTGTRESIDVVAAAVPPTFEEVNSIMTLHYGVTMPPYMLTAPTLDPNVATERANSPSNLLNRNAPISADAIRNYEVPLMAGNRITGRLFSYNPDTGMPIGAKDMYIHIIRDDKAVGPPIPIDARGEFVAELPDGPGAYSIVAAGKGGFGAAGFYAVAGNNARNKNHNDLETNMPPEPTYLVAAGIAQDESRNQEAVAQNAQFGDPLIDQMEGDPVERAGQGGEPFIERPAVPLPRFGGMANAAGGVGLTLMTCSNDVIVPKRRQGARGGAGAGTAGGTAGGAAGGTAGGTAGGAAAGPGHLGAENRFNGSASTDPFGTALPGFDTPFVPAGFTANGLAGAGGQRGLGALLVGGGVAAAIAISTHDDDDRRQVSPFSP